MDKRKPTYDLAEIKAVMGAARTLAMTTSALQDAAALGFDRQAVSLVVASIERKMFLKSMTTKADHKVWQDVYHVPADDGLVLYVKFQSNVVTAFTVVSFKEK